MRGKDIVKDGSGLVITGTVYDDTITSVVDKNHHNNIAGLDGNDSISNNGSYTTVHGGTGRDYIYGWRAESNELFGDGDADTILTLGKNNKVFGGEGNDSILGGGEGSTLDGGNDNDTIINNVGNNITIYGGTGEDYIKNAGSHVLIDSSSYVTIINGSEFSGVTAETITLDGSFDECSDTVENKGHDVKITTGAGKDSIVNIGSDATITAENGSKTFTKNSEATIEAGEGNDTIWNKSTADSVSINAGAGEDYVYNVESSDVSIDGGIDNDRIFNGYYDRENDKSLKGGSNVSINGGAGDDYIENNGGTLAENGGNDVTILGGDDKDTIKNDCSNVTIDGGKGDDSITNERVEYYYAGQPMYRGDEVSINGGDDNNIINNGLYEGEIITKNISPLDRKFYLEKDKAGGDKVTIEAGTGDDSIFNRGSEVSIKAGDGKNTVKNGTFFGESYRYDVYSSTCFHMLDSVDGGDSVTIETGEDDDLIQSFNSSNVSINAGGGKNLISVSGNSSNITIKGGTGTDKIIFYTPKNFAEVDINTGEIPNDSRFGGSNISINASGGEKNLISVASTWSYVTINGSDDPEGVDAIFNDGKNALLKGNAGNDYIRNTSDFAIIFGGNHGDIIENYGNNVFIEGDDANGVGSNDFGDYIYTDKGNHVTIDGGAGNDLIEAWHDLNASISGGAGNDRIHLYRVSTEDKKNIWWKIAKIPAMEILSKYNAWTEFFSTAFGTAENLQSVYKADNIADILKGTAVTLGDLILPISSILDIKSYVDELNLTKSTVNGGAGDDTIVADGYAPRVFEYSGKADYGNDGNDIIYNFNENKTGKDSALSTLDITSGRVSNIVVIGNDVTFVVEKGSIKLVDGANKKFKLVEDEEDDSAFTRAYGINYDTGAVVCSIFGSSADEDIQDNVGIKRYKPTEPSLRDPAEPVENHDTIVGETFANVIYGYGGSDNLRGNDKNDTIYGGDGDDYIFGNGGNDVLYGDDGADKLYGGDGNDKIYSGTGDTVDGGNGDDFIYNSGNNVSISAGDDNDIVENFGEKVTIETGDGKDKIINNASYVTIKAGDNNDTIEVHNSNITVESGNGDDSICLGNISGSDSNVTFKVKVNAGANDDTVKSYISYATIVGDAGNDLISLSSYANRNFIEYKNGDGYDEIRGFDNNDTLKVTGGKYRRSIVGNDTIIKVGSGLITLKNYTSSQIHIDGTPDPDDLPEGVSIKDEILKLAKEFLGEKIDVNNFELPVKDIDAADVLKGIEIVGNEIIKRIIGSKYSDVIRVLPQVLDNSADLMSAADIICDDLIEEISAVTIEAGGGDDTIYGGEEKAMLYDYKAGDGNDLIYNFNETSTLQIGDGNGSYSSTKSGSDIVVTVGDGKITLVGATNLSTVNIAGKKVTPTPSTTKIYTNSDSSKVTLGSSIRVGNASKRTKAIKLTGNELDNSLLGGSGKDTIYGTDGNDSLVGNAGNDKLYGQNGDDTLWGGSGNDTLKGGDGDDLFIYSAGNDVISDYAKGDKISLGAAISKSSVKGSDATFTIGKNTLTVKNGKDKELVFIDAKGTERTIIGGAYLATDSSSSNSTLAAWREVGDASVRTKAIKLTGNALDNSILGGSGKDSLYGDDGDDYLAGGKGNDKLYGQNGDDTLWGGIGNDTLKGGDGNDLFIYSAGKDVISDYAMGDKISIGAAISKSSVKGSDATFTISSNTLTVKNGKGKEIVFIDASGTERTIIGGAYLATDSSSANSTLAAWREVGDASARTKAIKLTGNALDNSILGGSGKDTLYGADGNDSLVGNAGNDKIYGQNGNDTLWGGIGNDTLKGGAGADVFIYNSGEGKDVISDFGNDDLLQITGTFSATYNKSSKTIAFKVDSTASAITLKNFTATTFNINGDTWKISGSKLVKK